MITLAQKSSLIFKAVFTICALLITSEVRANYAYDNIQGIKIFTVNTANTGYTFQLGTLFAKQGFVAQNSTSTDLSIIGVTDVMAFLSKAYNTDFTPLNGKMLLPLATWLQLDNATGNNSHNLQKFTRSTGTYSFNNISYVIVGLASGGSTHDTAPKLSPVSTEWDAEVGQLLSIPLSVSDAEQDSFVLTGNPAGTGYSSQYIADNGLPTVDFQWTPGNAQANKVVTIKFKAKETAAKKLSSNTISVKIRVWPAGGETDSASVSKFTVATAQWANGALALTGKVQLNKIMSAPQKSAFLAKQLDAAITQGKTGAGLPIGTYPLSLQANGNWSLTAIPLPATVAFSCQVTLEYEGQKSSRTISRAPKNCLKN